MVPTLGLRPRSDGTFKRTKAGLAGCQWARGQAAASGPHQRGYTKRPRHQERRAASGRDKLAIVTVG